MENINVPIFRARATEKIWGGGVEKGDYVIGYFFQEAMDYEDGGSFVYPYFIKQGYGDHFQDIEIDPSTLAINFPDMTDSQGNRIFASLSSDGKGGDIVEDITREYKKGNKAICQYESKGKFYARRINNFAENWALCWVKRNTKVIGIQE